MASARNSAPSVLNRAEDSKYIEKFSDQAIMKMDYMKFDKDFIAWSEDFPDGLDAKSSAEEQLPNSSAMTTSLELNQVDRSLVSNRVPVDDGNGDSEIKQEKKYDIHAAQRGTQKRKLDFAFRLITAGHKSLTNNLIQAENRTIHVKSFVPHSAERYSAPPEEALRNNSNSNIIYENKSMAMALMRMMIKNISFRQQLETGKKTVLQVVNEENIANKLTKITEDHTPDTCIGADYNLNHDSGDTGDKYFQQNLDPEKEIRCQVLNKERNSYKVIGTAADHTVATCLFADNVSKFKGPFALTNREHSYDSDSNATDRDIEHFNKNPDNDMEIDIAEGIVLTSYDGVYKSDKAYVTGTNNYNGSTGLVQRENINMVAKSELQHDVLNENVSTVNWNAQAMNNDYDTLPSASMMPSSMVEGLNGRDSLGVNFHKKCFRITPPWLKYANNSNNCKTYETGINNYNGSTGLVQRKNINMMAKGDLQHGVLDENVSTVNWNAQAMNNDLDTLSSANMAPSSMVESLNGRNSFGVNLHKKCFKITPPWLKYVNKLEKRIFKMGDDIVTKYNVYTFESETTSVNNRRASVNNLKKLYQKVWTRDQLNVAMDHTYSYDGTNTETPVE